MGHRALIIIEKDREPGLFTTRGSHWGALEAGHLGADYEDMKRCGTRHDGVYDTLQDAAADAVDFLYHEAVYVARPHHSTKAFDTLWWRGARQYVPSPGGRVGVGALVELYANDEWGDFSHWSDREGSLWKRTQEMDVEEFHNYVRNSEFASRVPDWSPLGGGEIRVNDRYRGNPVEA